MTPNQIVGHLQAVASQTGLPLEKNLADIAKWYFEQDSSCSQGDVVKRQELQDKTIRNLLIAFIQVCDRLRTEERSRSSIITPDIILGVGKPN